MKGMGPILKGRRPQVVLMQQVYFLQWVIYFWQMCADSRSGLGYGVDCRLMNCESLFGARGYGDFERDGTVLQANGTPM